MKSKTILTLIIAALLTGAKYTFNLPHPTVAQTSNGQPSSKVVKFRLPPRGTKGDRQAGVRGAATRHPCDTYKKEQGENEWLTALIPDTNLGLTVSASPSFWYYFPYEASDAITGEFLLKQNRRVIERQILSFNNTPGIIKISLPETVKLEADKLYRWQLSVTCQIKGEKTTLTVEGGVKRDSKGLQKIIDSENQLKTANQLEEISFYAQNGLWFETVTKLAELYRLNPEDNLIKNNWVYLLEDLDLGEISSKPLVSCCHSQ